MTKSHLKESQSSTPPPPETCDVDGIISGLDFESFVLLPGTRNAKPGMKFAEVAEVPEEMGDYQLEYSASVFESPSMPSMYFYSPAPYWGSPFLVTSPQIEGKKSRKNKNKKKREKQRQQRLERDAQLQAANQLASPLSPKSDSEPLTPKSNVDKKPSKKKRNKQRRRGSGRARRASAPQYLLHEGIDPMSMQFAGLNVHDHDISGFQKTGLYTPLTHMSPRARGLFWNQVPVYGQAY